MDHASEELTAQRHRIHEADKTVVLLVDDEPTVRNMLRIMLEGERFIVLAAANGEEALHLADDFDGAIHIVVTDVIMPKMGGIELRDHLLAKRPNIKVLLISGHIEAPARGVPFLRKPFRIQELKAHIQDVLTTNNT